VAALTPDALASAEPPVTPLGFWVVTVTTWPDGSKTALTATFALGIVNVVVELLAFVKVREPETTSHLTNL